MAAWLILLACILLPMFWAVGAYKRLVGLRSSFQTAFLQVHAQSKRRHDLVPGLVEIARGYLMHERQTLDAVTAARNQAFTASVLAADDPTDAAAMQRMAGTEAALMSSLEQMMALSHACPALWADAGMLALASGLGSTDRRLVFAQQAYNDSVAQYNQAIVQFPGSLLAAVFGFRRAAPLQALRSAEDRRGQDSAALRRRP